MNWNTWLIIHQVFATRKIILELKLKLSKSWSSKAINHKSKKGERGEKREQEERKKIKKKERKEEERKKKTKEKAYLVGISWLELEVLASLKVSPWTIEP